MHLASSDDSDVREAALRGLLELAQDKEDGASPQFGEDDEKMKELLQDRIRDISSMSADDLGAAREERQLVDSLWNACYKEPSSLREKGLLVLPGEDAPPPDVASKHFEPPLRAWAANRGGVGDVSNSSNTEKKQTPLLLGSGPSSGAPDVSSNSEGRPDSRTS